MNSFTSNERKYDELHQYCEILGRIERIQLCQQLYTLSSEIMAVSVASDYTVSPTEDVKDMLFAYDVAYFASMLTDSV
ncbi:hypothetical protein E3P90_04161 [Wallemia ichthyophaga]|uniref:Uncharacterized protein n=1 Tax=Wallemia ichthyophaga TaxID=245174 RepID=A0A4T0GZ26_WALIC|nr:hypothetical protein E3P90_04161 [Wallemia ichthyophaga]